MRLASRGWSRPSLALTVLMLAGGAHAVGTRAAAGPSIARTMANPPTPDGVAGRQVRSQTFQYRVLHSFLLPPANPRAGLTQGSDGYFYGTTQFGGTDNEGTVFRITPDGVFTVLHSFSSTGGDGEQPTGQLTQASDGNFYGTTKYGGDNGQGTVFRMTPAGAVTIVYSFSGSDGRTPWAGVIEGRDGNFYGTTRDGGPNADGTIFRLTPSGTLTTLHFFAVDDGENPVAELIQGSNGDFYGTTFYGGANRDGTVFRITPAGALTTLYSFAGTDGADPSGELVQAIDGTLYGTTQVDGGPNSRGTLFALAPSGTLTTLHFFTGTGGDGANPLALIRGSDGSLYGTTEAGGANQEGTVFALTAGGVFATIYSFTGSQSNDGGEPYGRLVQGSDGNLYGTTFRNGVSNGGAVYGITPAGALTMLHPFTMETGRYPSSVLIQASGGDFYATTYNGGPSDNGTVFAISATGTLRMLHFFTGKPSDGANPQAGVVQGTDGNFYGMTFYGGTADDGTIFKMDSSGNVTILHSFTGQPLDGANPEDDLIQGSDGNFYGTTYFGGLFDKGTVFKMDSSGNVSTLYSFTGLVLDGARPYGRLVQGSDGNLYGTTQIGGQNNYGTVFRITPGGSLTTIHSFAGTDGSQPLAGLIEGGDGNFYGTTEFGGATDNGTVFAVTPAGDLTTLHSFAGSDGAVPIGALVQARDGHLYGTTSLGGDNGHGTVFELPLPGDLTTVHPFGGVDGARPFAGLVQGADGDLYGTTLFGGRSDIGVVYALTPGSPTGVRVASFGVRRVGRLVVVSWRTASEAQLLGFNLYRDGRRLNRTLIAARRSGQAVGAAYRFVDRSAPETRPAFYRLELVSPAGGRSSLGPVRLRPR